MVLNFPRNWQVHYDYARSGMGMIFPFNQNWRTSKLPFSISLANRVNTGVSFDTPSGGIAERQRWASRGMGWVGFGAPHGRRPTGFRGYGPRIQYPGGAGMDGMGCGCGCGGDCGHEGGMMPLLCLGALAVAAYYMGKRNTFNGFGG